ncbi:MAG: ribosome-associated translation inhibitor RaiA [Clostridia bacterium]|nr:ribosome-associated translation inhibitor RaiA [Clostridia bacterium]
MKITVIGRKCTPRDSFKEHAEKKLQKIDRFFGDEASAKVTATVEKTSQTVEITVNNDGLIFRAQAKAENMNEALDDCVDLLIRQIRKNKTKLEKRLRSGAFDDYQGLEDEEPEFELVRTKTIPIKPQSVDEAILQMNMLGHKFYMFRNSANDSVAVVYRREDGGYGLIEPEAAE